MEIFSQGNEQTIIKSYFNGGIGVFADFGSNDGRVLSNTHALALSGWSGICVEPSPTPYAKLCELYLNRSDIETYNLAIGTFKATAKFYDSGSHLNKGDTGLLSSLYKKTTEKWIRSTFFDEIDIEVIDVETLLSWSRYKKIDFFSIDCEGSDVEIMRQLDFRRLETRCVCIEHNSDRDVLGEIKDYCKFYGLTNQLLLNAENIILAK